MYNLPYFKEEDIEVVKQFAKSHPFAFLTGVNSDNQPVATQLPVFIDEREGRLFLSGHLMKNTDHHRAFVSNPSVLIVFTGPHTYVSASWYTDKQQGSTWNYMSVHARGNMRFLGEQELISVLKRTTNHFENNPDSGSNFEDIPDEYVQRMIKAIVAFEIEVESFDNVFKLSQNRDEKSCNAIIHQLKQRDADAAKIAAIMEERKAALFKS